MYHSNICKGLSLTESPRCFMHNLTEAAIISAKSKQAYSRCVLYGVSGGRNARHKEP